MKRKGRIKSNDRRHPENVGGMCHYYKGGDIVILQQKDGDAVTVYLIHFQTNLHHARHYVGYADKVNKRLAHHRDGSGARLLAVCNERGIGYDLARTWEGQGRDFERKLKNCKNAARYCPVCNPHAREYRPKDGKP